MSQVAYTPKGTDEFEIATLVQVKGSWVTLRDADGHEFKVRKGQVALDDDANPDESALEALLTDEDLDEDGEVRSGDVFPEGIRERYVKGKTETGRTFIDCGDELAAQLRDASLEEVALRAEQVLGQRNAAGWIAFYTTDREAEGKSPLNPGMVRMNLGNRIRAAIKRQEQEALAQAEGKDEADAA